MKGMKYSKIYFLFVLVFLLPLAGCEDQILDLEDKDGVPASQALNTLDGVEAILTSIKLTGRSYRESTNMALYKIAGTDIVKSGTNLTDDSQGAIGIQLYSNILSPVDESLEGRWNGLYSAIANCNTVLASAETFKTNSQAEADRLNSFEGEALALRAFLYLELVRRWENIPVSEPLPEGSDPILESPLVDKSEIYNLIVGDCIKALEILPTRAETGSVGTGSKGLANMLLAEAYLDMGNYSEAAAAAEAVINDNSYYLQPLDGIFGLEGGKTGTENNNEIVFSFLFDPAVQARANRSSQLMVPLYDRLPGVARTMDQGGRPWGRLSPNAYYWSLFEDGDGRLGAWHKLTWTLDDPDNIITSVGLSEGDEVTPEYVQAWCSNENECRYLEPTTSKNFENGTYGRTTDVIDGFRNVIEYRLSNAYLLAAEAYVQQGNGGKAAELLNVLRERAFGNSDHNFSDVDLETLIEEHARELGHEGHRWTFLKRLGILEERVKEHDELGNMNIQSHHVRLPIPQSFVDLAGVQQNPGY
jgi:tetratricopeptide (TPR) repeat protein